MTKANPPAYRSGNQPDRRGDRPPQHESAFSLTVFDLRCHNRLTETGMTPIDTALTFTGLAAQLLEVSQ